MWWLSGGLGAEHQESQTGKTAQGKLTWSLLPRCWKTSSFIVFSEGGFVYSQAAQPLAGSSSYTTCCPCCTRSRLAIYYFVETWAQEMQEANSGETFDLYPTLNSLQKKTGQHCRGDWDLKMKTGHTELFFYGGFRRTKESAIGVGQILRLSLLRFWLQWEWAWIKTTGGLRMWPHVGCLGETGCQQLGQANNFCLLKIKSLFSNAQQRLLLMTAAGIDWNQN